jgi:hypothetical protein
MEEGMSLHEEHYTPKALGAKIGVSAATIIRWIKDDPDVIRLYNPSRQRKRAYTTYSIPEHVAQRVYSDHLRKSARRLVPGADRRKVDFVVRHERRKVDPGERRKTNQQRRLL